MRTGPVTSGRTVFGVPLRLLLLVTMLIGLPLCDWTIAASCQPYQRVTGEWQFVCTAEHEPVPGVEVGQPVLIADVVAVLNGKAGGIERVGVERLRPRIGGGELQAA